MPVLSPAALEPRIAEYCCEDASRWNTTQAGCGQAATKSAEDGSWAMLVGICVILLAQVQMEVSAFTSYYHVHQERNEHNAADQLEKALGGKRYWGKLRSTFAGAGRFGGLHKFAVFGSTPSMILHPKERTELAAQTGRAACLPTPSAEIFEAGQAATLQEHLQRWVAREGEQEDEGGAVEARAVSDFNDEPELFTLARGELVVLTMCEEGEEWWNGYKKAEGRSYTGNFPANCVSRVRGSGQGRRLAKAVYDFVPELPSELAFSAGDELNILTEDAHDWVYAEHAAAGGQGLVPKAYLEMAVG